MPYTVKLHLVPLHGHFWIAKFLALTAVSHAKESFALTKDGAGIQASTRGV